MNGASWRFAARLARREVRRRPGRTLLVMLLIAIPVCGMTVITVFVRTNQDSPAEAFAREFGRADLVGQGQVGAASGSVPTANFPAGTRVVRGHTFPNDIGLETANGTARLAQVTDLDLNDPITHGAVLLRTGRFPARAGEALISPKLANAFGVGVGGTLHLSSPNWTEKIVGIGVRATSWNDGFVAVRGNELTSFAATGQVAPTAIELVDLPGRPSSAELLQYTNFISSATFGGGGSTRAVNWILVAGIIALAIVGIVISGAFAVGARRQLVTLGQLSANGADEQLLRRTLSLQGFLSGAIGSVVGFGAGIVVLLALRTHFETWIQHDPGPYVWTARDTLAILVTGVITATVAAFIPARSAARVPVLSALAGRRPLGTLPRRLVPIGAALFASGVFVLVLVATASTSRSGDGLAMSAVFGGVLVLAGSCCASSIVVASLGRAAGAARGAVRVAVRSVVRSRARSAAVVMALAAINAGAIAMGTAVESRTSNKVQVAAFMPDNTLIVTNSAPLSGDSTQEAPPAPTLPVPAAITSALRKIVPTATFATRRVVVGTIPIGLDLPRGIVKGDGGGRKVIEIAPARPTIAAVTDPAVLAMLGLSARDAAALRNYGAIVVTHSANGQQFGVTQKNAKTVHVQVGSPAHDVVAAVAQDSVRSLGGDADVFITEAKAEAIGSPIVAGGLIVTNPKPFDEAEQASIDVFASLGGFVPGAAANTNIVWNGTTGNRVSINTVREIVLAIVVLIALIVLAMSLALSAAETRDERDILVSLGARPSTMRSVSAWKAALLSASGALVAIPTGFIPVAVVVLALAHSDQVAHVVFPWSTELELVVAAPIVAGMVAYVDSTLAQTLRPTRMSTFATD